MRLCFKQMEGKMNEWNSIDSNGFECIAKYAQIRVETEKKKKVANKSNSIELMLFVITAE